jgi:molybdopterin synthase catalytic subunit
MDFRLTNDPIDVAGLGEGLRDVRAGACVTFEGRVRAENQGREVRELEYEAYDELALTEGERILAEARARFGLVGAACVHRKGRLALGDVAVAVAVTAAHRGAAFDACRFVIDEIKARVPIWKKEHYADGASEWTACASRGPGGAPPA